MLLPTPLALRLLLGFGQWEVGRCRREQIGCEFLPLSLPDQSFELVASPVPLPLVLVPALSLVLLGSPLVLTSGCPPPLAGSPSSLYRPHHKLPSEGRCPVFPARTGLRQTGRMGHLSPGPSLFQRSWLPGRNVGFPTALPCRVPGLPEPPPALFIY